MNENEIKNIDIESEMLTDSEIEQICKNSKTQYMQEIGRIPLLTKEEEISAFEKYKSGDSSMKSYIAEHNLRLVVSVVYRVLGKGYNKDDFMDYVQEGNIGLMKAIDKYNENHESGISFSSYAYYWVLDSIMRAYQSSGIIRVPVYIMENIQKVKKFTREFEVHNGYAPSVEEISKGTKLSIEKVKEALKQFSSQTVSIDDVVNAEDDNNNGLYGVLEQNTFESPEEKAIENDMKVAVAELLTHLTETERAVIELAFGFVDGEEKTYQEIGDILGFSKQRANTLCKRALGKLYNLRSKVQAFAEN